MCYRMVLPKVILESQDTLLSSFKGPQGGLFSFSSGGYREGGWNKRAVWAIEKAVWAIERVVWANEWAVVSGLIYGCIVGTMILFSFKYIHPNEMKFSVFSETRQRGCDPISKIQELKSRTGVFQVNGCYTFCHKQTNVFYGALCFCDSDLCNKMQENSYSKQCSKSRLRMALEAPYDKVQWKLEGTKPGSEDDPHRRSSTQVHIVPINFIIASEERRSLENRHENARTTPSS